MTVKSTSAISLVFAGLLATRPALAQEATTDRPVVTIAPFETGRTGWVPPSGFGQIMAERLGQRLVESGHYRVLDSELLTREPSGARPGVVPLQAWRDRAERAGVSYLLIGSVTQYSKEERRRSGGGATAVLQLIIGARLHVPIAGAGRSTQTESIVGVSVRLIDVHSGEILTIANGEGIASRTDRAGGGFGAIHGLPIAGGFSDSRSGAATAMLDEAVRHAVDQAAESITKAAGLLPQSAPRPNLDGAAR